MQTIVSWPNPKQWIIVHTSDAYIFSQSSQEKWVNWKHTAHYNDVIMITIASQITSLTVVYSTVYSNADQRKHQSSASLAFVWGIHRDRWIPRTKGQLRGKCFHLMTSSCSHIVQWITERICLIVLTHLTKYIWQAYYKFNVFRWVCTMMIMRWCTVQTNEYHLQAKTYPTICTHQNLHNTNEKIPFFPEYGGYVPFDDANIMSYRYILSIAKTEMGQLNTYNPIYCYGNKR